jgi:hypothetical protein
MALTITETNAVSNKVFDKTLTTTCYDKSPFWVRLKQESKVRGQFGTSIQWPIRYKQATDIAAAVNPDDQVVFRNIDTRTAATLEMAYYRAQSLITWKERAQNMGEAQIIDLLKDKAKEMQEELYHRFATDLYTYNSSGLGIQPLSYVVDSTQTYGGIAAADASTWVAWRDASTTALTLYGAGSLSYYQNVATFGTDAPSLHVTTRNLYSKFMSLFEGQKIYQDNKLADAGFDNIKFMGAPIVADFYCPASYWYGIDIGQIEFRVQNDYDFKLTDWFPLEQAGHPESMARVISFAGNLKIMSRRTSFKYSTLNYTL